MSVAAVNECASVPKAANGQRKWKGMVLFMSNVIRVFVEKRPGFDIEAQHILADLRDNLGLTAITGLRFANR